MITIQEILKEMDSGRPFSLTVVKYDRQRKTGGELLEIPEAILVQADPAPVPGQRAATPYEAATQAAEEAKRRDPSHFDHYTRNIRILADGTPTSLIRKIHVPLIVCFNGDPEVAD